MCVSHAHGRDYCITCVGPIWEAVCKVLGADPDTENKDSMKYR